MEPASPSFLLHTYYKSSCSARLRIACHLKDLEVEYVFVALHQEAQFSAAHRALNPSATVPILTCTSKGAMYPIAQSIAALEYLEELLPNRRSLLPPLSDPLSRAKVRVLVNIIACDTQPMIQRRLVGVVEELGGNGDQWSNKWMTRGLLAYEEAARETAGKFSVGDEITLADVCLVPQVWAAEKSGVDLEALPVVSRIFRAMSSEEAVIKSHWKVQKDTPEDTAWL